MLVFNKRNSEFIITGTYIRVLLHLIKVIVKMWGIHIIIVHKMAKGFSVRSIHKYTLQKKRTFQFVCKFLKYAFNTSLFNIFRTKNGLMEKSTSNAMPMVAIRLNIHWSMIIKLTSKVTLNEERLLVAWTWDVDTDPFSKTPTESHVRFHVFHFEDISQTFHQWTMEEIGSSDVGNIPKSTAVKNGSYQVCIITNVSYCGVFNTYTVYIYTEFPKRKQSHTPKPEHVVNGFSTWTYFGTITNLIHVHISES